MSADADLSANEVEILIYKAARGGGLPLGHAEDLAATARFLDLDGLHCCPCSGDTPAAMSIPMALDHVMAGHGVKTVTGDAALIAAYVASAQVAWGKTLLWRATEHGAVFEQFEDNAPVGCPSMGRRMLPPKLAAHLTDMASNLLVPETDDSRNAGAGAGISDND